MYEVLLTLHNLLRWLVVIVVALAAVRGLAGLRGGRPFAAADQKLELFGMIGLDIQLLIGLLLYLFFSPLADAALSSLGTAMKNGELRYWGVEHAIMMLAAVVCVHLGRLKSKRAQGDAARYKAVAVYYGIAILVMLAAMPWPFRADIGRPLLPF
jgi:hypothetical protein